MERAMRRAAAALAAILVCAPGCFLTRDAKISYMAPGGNLMNGQLECWLEVEFTGQPAGDLRDVVVEFDSIVMAKPQRFDWSYIAVHDRVRKGDFAGYKRNEATTPDGVPPRDLAIRVNYPLKSLQRVDLDAGDDLELTATLYWGGERQHSVSRSLAHVYHREGAGF